MALLPPFYLDAVVAIGSGDDPAKRSWVGTGFLYGTVAPAKPTAEKSYFVFLVTNKHVLQGKSKIWIKFNSISGSGSQDFDAPLKARNGKDLFVSHPDPSVDLAAIFINADFLRAKNLRFAFVKSDEHTFTVAELKSAGAAEGDGVFVLGYPLGLVEDRWQAAICRSGCIARLQDTLVSPGKDFLIDAAVFPGNSGGPVFIQPQAIAISGTKTIAKANLVGVVKAYVPYQDVAISRQTGRARITFDENSGLSPVIPVDRVNELMAHALKRLKSRLAQAKWKARQSSSGSGTGSPSP